MVDQCGNCTFYASTAQVCRCFAPRAVYSQLQTFPHLEPDDWCGDYSTATTNVGSCSVCFFYNSTIRVCRFNAPFSAEQPEIFAYVAPEQWCGNFSTLPKPGPGGGEASAAYELASQALATARNAYLIASQGLATAQNARLVADQALGTASTAILRANTAQARADAAYDLASAYGAPWSAFNPVVTANTGTITSTTINNARYKVIGKTCFVSVYFTITNNGDGSVAVECSVPATANTTAIGAGSRNPGVTMLRALLESGYTKMQIRSYDGTYPGATGADLRISIAYETE